MPFLSPNQQRHYTEGYVYLYAVSNDTTKMRENTILIYTQ